MRPLVVIILVSFLFIACEKNKDNEQGPQLNGAYSGTFNRTGMDTANVLLRIGSNNTYDGSSDHAKYPAICRGSFDQDGNDIYFVDSCSWTADFDWTLILNGTYHISYLNDRDVRIWRTNGSLTDEYMLKKIVR